MISDDCVNSWTRKLASDAPLTQEDRFELADILTDMQIAGLNVGQLSRGDFNKVMRRLFSKEAIPPEESERVLRYIIGVELAGQNLYDSCQQLLQMLPRKGRPRMTKDGGLKFPKGATHGQPT